MTYVLANEWERVECLQERYALVPGQLRGPRIEVPWQSIQSELEGCISVPADRRAPGTTDQRIICKIIGAIRRDAENRVGQNGVHKLGRKVYSLGANDKFHSSACVSTLDLSAGGLL